MRKSIKRLVSSILAASMVLTSSIASNVAFAVTSGAAVETGTWDVRYGDNYTAAAAAGETVYTENGVSVIAVNALTYGEVAGDTFATGGERTYTGYVKTPGSGANQTITADGEKVTSFRVAFEITNEGTDDAVVNIDHKVGSGKTNYVLGNYDAAAATATVVDSKLNEGSSSTYETFALTLGAGETVYVAGRGSDICVYGINVATSESSDSDDDSGDTSDDTTVEPTVDTGAWDVRYGDNYTAAAAAGETVYTENGVSVIAANALTYGEVAGDTFATGGERTYTGYVKTPGSGANQTITADGEKVTSFRVAFEITNEGTGDAVVNIDHKVGSGKTNYVLGNYDAAAATATVVDSKLNEGSSSTYETFVLTLGAGETVYVAGRGSDICIYGINITTDEDDTQATTVVEDDTQATTADTQDATTAEEDDTQATTVVEDDTQATTTDTESTDGTATITPVYTISGSTVTVNYNVDLADGAKFNNYTMTLANTGLTYVSAEDGDIALSGTYTDATGNAITVGASNVAQDVVVNDDGTITVAYCIFDNDFSAAAAGSLPAFTEGGTLFTIVYEMTGTEFTLGTTVDTLNAVSSDDTVESTPEIVVAEAEDATEDDGDDDDTSWDVMSGVGITEDVAEGEVIYTEGGVVISAANALTYKTVAGDVFDESGNTYTGYLQTSTSNTDLTLDDGTTLGFRAALVIENTGSDTATVEVDHKVSSGKTNYVLLVNADGTYTILDSSTNDTGSSTYETFTITLEAGQTVLVGGSGTNPCVYGFNVTTDSEGGDTPTPTPTGSYVLAGNKVSVAKSAVTPNTTTADVTFTFTTNPGVANYLVYITYDPNYLLAASGVVGSGFDYDSNVVNSQIAYIPTAGDTDYAGLGADGSLSAAELGKLKIAGISTNGNVTDDVALTITFTLLTDVAGEYPVSIEVVAVGDETAAILSGTSEDGAVVITDDSSSDEPGTEPGTDPDTEPGTTTPTTTQTTTTSSSSSSGNGGGGGGGSSRVTTTTTEATTEDTSSDSDDSTSTGIPAGVKINVPTEKDPDYTGFIDLGNYPWAEDSINKLAELGIISGIGDRLYGPALPCRRADFAILINRTLGLQVESTVKNFYDNEDASKYYYEDVIIGYNAGILSGYGDNNYKPEQYCTREEMAVLVAKTFEWMGNDVTSTDLSVNDKYTDVENISWWSAPYVAYLTSMGILNGNADGTMLPQNYINRAEMAVMMAKVYDYALDYMQSLVVEEETEETSEEVDEEAAETDDESAVSEDATETTTEEEDVTLE